MSERVRQSSSSTLDIVRRRSHACRESKDKVTRTSSELHRQTVGRAQRRFEQQLANSEHELRWAMRQRRDHSASPADKRQATEHLEHLRSTLNNDFAQLIQDKVEQVEHYMKQRREEERQLDKTKAHRQLQEAVQEAHLESEKTRLETINEIVRERDTMCEEKLAAQKSTFDRLLEEQARRIRAEQIFQDTTKASPAPPVEHADMAQLKGRLARMEYEHRELKQLVLDLRSELFAVLSSQQSPSYRSSVHIPRFVVQP